MNTFELEVLGAVSNDYEAVQTIHGNLERDLSCSVSLEELASVLTRLVELGFADAFVFDPELRNYRKVKVGSLPPTELWFYISAAGRIEYDRSVA